MRNGWSLRWEVKEHLVNDTISWGRELIEIIYLGADWRLLAQSLEYAIGFLTEMVWPWNGDGAYQSTNYPLVTTTFNVFSTGIGQRATNSASGALVLTAVTGTTAATFGPATLTAKQAVQSGGLFGMDSRNRENIVNLRLLPDHDPGIGTTWFITS